MVTCTRSAAAGRGVPALHQRVSQYSLCRPCRPRTPQSESARAAPPFMQKEGWYGAGAPDHDPEDAVAPLDALTTAGERAVLAVLGAVMPATVPDAERRGVGARRALPGLPGRHGRRPPVPPAAERLHLRRRRRGAGRGGRLSDRTVLEFTGAWVGALAYSGFLFVSCAAYQLTRGREGMGLGDVKLATAAELRWAGTLSPVLILYSLIFASLLGIIVGSGFFVVREARSFPFGPSPRGRWSPSSSPSRSCSRRLHPLALIAFFGGSG